MKITRFALGIRFAAMAEQPHKEFARKIFEGIFSVLTLSELEDLTLYGGADPFSPANAEGEESDVYLVVLMGGKLKQMRKVYHAIADDAALDMYMVHNRPFVENNRLYKVEGLDYFGQVRPNGRIEGGDGTLDGLSVPKKRGRRKPVGKGIRVMLAPADYERLTSTDAIKRMTVAARRHFQGVKLAPFPINDGGEGFGAKHSYRNRRRGKENNRNLLHAGRQAGRLLRRCQRQNRRYRNRTGLQRGRDIINSCWRNAAPRP